MSDGRWLFPDTQAMLSGAIQFLLRLFHLYSSSVFNFLSFFSFRLPPSSFSFFFFSFRIPNLKLCPLLFYSEFRIPHSEFLTSLLLQTRQVFCCLHGRCTGFGNRVDDVFGSGSRTGNKDACHVSQRGRHLAHRQQRCLPRQSAWAPPWAGSCE